ncbi:MAG: ATP-binding cassette domain-containing protein [Alphaproteobacteria bacterium]|nr:ATP-binding cassette domain-containing protein [Alphaproteobacteria bacterium]
MKPSGFKIDTGSLLLTTLAINILSLALPVTTLQVYDRILPAPGSGTLPVLISGVCLAVVLEAALRLTRAYTMGRAGAAYEHRLSCAAMNHLLQADLSRLGEYGIGEHLHRMSAIGKLKDFYSGYAQMTIFELVLVPLFLCLAIYIAGPLAIVPAFVLMIFTIVSFARGQKLRAALKARDRADDARYNFLIEGLEGIHTLKSFSLENSFARRYEVLQETSTLGNFSVTEATANTFNDSALFSHLMVAAVITIGALFVLQGQITTGALIATVLLSGRMMQPIQRALALWARYQDYVLAKEKVETLFETPRHFAVAANDEAPERKGDLSLRHLSFQHERDGVWLLKNIDLELNAGECVLLHADHSASKGAFLDMLAGIYPPTTGDIVIDGVNILRYSPERLIQHVGLIRTEGLIFRGTIRDNMTCFGQIEGESVREVAALLKIDREIAKLPAGFDTFLTGGQADTIPPGLKQRISMVRVLASKPRIIIFDNADLALDREGYNAIYSLLARLKGRVSMILISGDCNIRSLAERSFVLENGALSEDTDHLKHNAFVRL